MDDHALPDPRHSDRPLGIDDLTPAERLDEVAQILATGLQRWRARQLARHTAAEPVGPAQVRLDFAPAQSMHAAPLRPRRERP